MRHILLAVLLITFFVYLTKEIFFYSHPTLFLHHTLTFKNQLGVFKSSLSPLRFQTHVMRPGDNLWNLSKINGLNIDTLVSINRLKDIHTIVEGKKILIPNTDGLLQSNSHGQSTVDWLKRLSKTYRIAEPEITFYNPFLGNASKTVEPATELFIPGARYSLKERIAQLGLEFLNPLSVVFRITGHFGFRIHPVSKKRSFHKGIDLGGVRIGTPVHAAMSGRVTFAGTSYGYGKMVILRHKKDYETRYAHLSRIQVRVGQKVPLQSVVGYVGKTGIVTGPHLHFEIRKGRKPINPRGITDFHR